MRVLERWENEEKEEPRGESGGSGGLGGCMRRQSLGLVVFRYVVQSQTKTKSVVNHVVQPGFHA